jgi:hypothetical protein
VNPQIWRLAGPFIDEPHFYMIEKLFNEGSVTDQQAAALVCADSSFERTKLLLTQYPQYKNAIDDKTLTWDILEEQ